MNPLKSIAEEVQILFIDLQPGLIAASQTVKPPALATAAGVLAKIANVLDIPMTFCLVPEQGGPGSLIPELAEYATEKTSFRRVVASPFMEPAIVSALAAHDRKILVIAGFSAEVAVLQSTLGAIGAGYTVQIPVDTMGSRSARTEDAVMRQMEKAGAIPTSVLSLSALLAPDFSQQPGSAVLSALAGLRAAS
ncbi:isochorismatase family protein [Burkholderia plantarii]|uniref:isochorismatase family protein n=1 Tax=Burkholderia plantarii TaxID=41899 RepID=UPI0018DD3367|nr:isochorismatase family protein [Burkholderia plantarii]MBI0329265.1 isochorismatase family protein [Burkholderia plantarii]